MEGLSLTIYTFAQICGDLRLVRQQGGGPQPDQTGEEHQGPVSVWATL